MAAKMKNAKSKIAQSNLLGPTSDRKTRFKDEDKESLAYKVLTADQTKILIDLEDVDSVQSNLHTILKLVDTGTDLKEGATLDYYVSGVWWSKEQGYTADQLSAHFTVLHQMLENIKEKQLSMTDCLVEFKKLFAGVGVDNPEISGGLGCFDTNQAKQIMEYFQSSLFQHYKIYEFVFGATQAEEIIGSDLTVEVPQPADIPWPPPLEEAVPEELYLKYIATPPPTPEIKVEEASGQGEAGDSATNNRTQDEQGEGHVADLLAQLEADEVKGIMNDIFEEMLGGLKTEVQSKLRQKENDYINRINKVHRTPSAKSSKS